MSIDYEVTAGATSRRISIWLADSSSTTGAGLTGLAFNSSGLTCYYWREDEGNVAGTAVTLATATRGTFTSSGFIEKDATNLPGLYEFGLPNAAIATGAKWVKLLFRGATNLAPKIVTIKLVSLDMDTALSSQTVGTVGSLAAQAKADVNAEADTALADVGLTTTVTGRIDTTISSRSSHSASDVWAVGTRTLTSLTGVAADIRAAVGLASANLDTQLATIAGYIDTEIASLISTLSTVSTNVTTVLNRLGAWAGSGRNTILGALQALFRKDSDASVPSDINTNLGSGAGAANNTTDSVEAIRDRGDAAWVTATGFSTHSAADVWAVGTRTLTSISGLASELRAAVGLASANLDTQFATLPTAAQITTAVWAAATRTLTGNQGVKKNTALANFMFRMTDSTNHVPTSGLTVTAQRTIDNGSFSACANAVSEVGSGWYRINFATTDLNGDTIALKFTAPGADQLDISIVTGA
jgi:hypothetical protein